MKNKIPTMFNFPTILVQKNGINLLLPSMVLSTLAVCALATFVPALMPLWMSGATGSRV